MSCQDVTTKIGKVLLFAGIETYNYSDAQFQALASFCAVHRIDSILLKVGDSGNLWYGGFSGFPHIRDIFYAKGVGIVPYIYSYGDKFGLLQVEMKNIATYLQLHGVVCVNAEIEWSSHAEWAEQFSQYFQGHNGYLLLSTFADPSLQNWDGVLKVMDGVLDAVMPQEYTTYLHSTEYELKMDNALCIQPTVYLGTDLPSDPVAIARESLDAGYTSISMWYENFAYNRPDLVDQIVAVYKPLPKDTTAMDKQFDDVWKSSELGTKWHGSGIYAYVLSLYHEGKISACTPLTSEIDTVDWNNNPIIYQVFSNGLHAEYRNGPCTVYDAQNRIIA